MCDCGNPLRVDKRGYVHTSCNTCRRRRHRHNQIARGQGKYHPYTRSYFRRKRVWLIGKRCEKCGTTEDLTVDHINPLGNGGSLMNTTNWRALCDTHHQALTRAMHLFKVYAARRAIGAFGILGEVA